MSEPGFLQRWARRKAQARRDDLPALPRDARAAVPAPAVATEPMTPAAGGLAPSDPSAAARSVDPLPALETLTSADDFSPFMAEGVDAATRNGALRKLFSDPCFNVMDGLDTYIDDYGKPDPITPAMLRGLRQAHALGLFDDDSHGEQGTTTDGPPQAVDAAAAVEDAPGRSTSDGVPKEAEATAAAPGSAGFASAPGAHYDPMRRTGFPDDRSP